MSEIQRWTVIPTLKQVPGIADIENFGGITTQFQLELDPQQLIRFNLSLKNVTDAISANSANSGGSVLARGQLGYVIRGVGLVQTLEDMGNIVVTQRNGTPILVRDLGKLKLSNQERYGLLGKDDRNDGIAGIVLLLRNENPSRVIKDVHAKIAELNERLAQEDVRLVPYLDRSDLVDATVDKVSHTIFQGVGLVLIVLILFLGSPRSAVTRRHHDSVRDACCFHSDALHENSREPVVARRHRLRHHRRRRHRDVGGDPAAAGSEAG